MGPSNADFFDIRTQARSFASITMFDQKSMNLANGDQPERVGIAQVDSSFFHTLEVAPLIGREFRETARSPATATPSSSTTHSGNHSSRAPPIF